MSVQLDSLIGSIERLWPVQNAEEWDVVGLVSGDRKQNITKVLLTVDVTTEVVDYAIEVGANLIFAHHPLLLKSVTNVAEDTSKGSVLAKLIKSGIALYSAHTNSDAVPTGTSALLANAIGLTGAKPLYEYADGVHGIGKFGKLYDAITLGELAARLNTALPATATGVRVAGDFNHKVQTVALCAGAGDSYLRLALDSGADVYITSDLRHHPAQEILELAKARDKDFALIDISHWAAEFLWLEQAKIELTAVAPTVEIEICEIRTDVFDFLMNAPKSN
ncbi:MAG: Nif3-like dinuclear metal center hexameric protein [Microbacteriaceae bacterium]|nr:Nif3-like dinuclear metal center hexameric protein [Microbacteriaceae bacterium]